MKKSHRTAMPKSFQFTINAETGRKEFLFDIEQTCSGRREGLDIDTINAAAANVATDVDNATAAADANDTDDADNEKDVTFEELIEDVKAQKDKLLAEIHAEALKAQRGGA